MVEHHGIFQGYYFWHHIGLNRNTRDRFSNHQYYDRCEEFCAEYDGPAFDPNYQSNPIEHYEPLIRDFFGSGLRNRKKSES
jgi:predicted HD phosphohydrolase